MAAMRFRKVLVNHTDEGQRDYFLEGYLTTNLLQILSGSRCSPTTHLEGTSRTLPTR